MGSCRIYIINRTQILFGDLRRGVELVLSLLDMLRLLIRAASGFQCLGFRGFREFRGFRRFRV